MFMFIVVFFGNLRVYRMRNLTSIIILVRHFFPMLYMVTRIALNVEECNMTNKRSRMMGSTIRAQMAQTRFLSVLQLLIISPFPYEFTSYVCVDISE